MTTALNDCQHVVTITIYHQVEQIQNRTNPTSSVVSVVLVLEDEELSGVMVWMCKSSPTDPETVSLCMPCFALLCDPVGPNQRLQQEICLVFLNTSDRRLTGSPSCLENFINVDLWRDKFFYFFQSVAVWWCENTLLPPVSSKSSKNQIIVSDK